MNSDTEYAARILGGGVAGELGRMAIVAAAGKVGFVESELRRMVPTYVVESLRELRQAFAQSQAVEQQLVALDIRDLTLEDTETLGSCLAATPSHRGVVYLMSSDQFGYFAQVEFGFVFRL